MTDGFNVIIYVCSAVVIIMILITVFCMIYYRTQPPPTPTPPPTPPPTPTPTPTEQFTNKCDYRDEDNEFNFKNKQYYTNIENDIQQDNSVAKIYETEDDIEQSNTSSSDYSKF